MSTRDFDEHGKVIPDRVDFEAVEESHGRLPANAPLSERAYHYQLAQANKLIRIVQMRSR